MSTPLEDLARHVGRRFAEEREQLRRDLEVHKDGAIAEIEQAIARVKDGEPGPPGEKGDPANIEPIVAAVLETLRQDQLDLSESMFAARRRFDSLVEQVETLRGPAGEPGPEGRPGRDGETGEARGLHDPEAAYRKLDRVSFNGSEWIARQDDPGPLPGDGWVMGAQRGQRGKPGPAGERGEQGRTGQPGPGISRAEIGDGFAVRFVMDNGAAFAVDLRPLFERYDQERA